MSEPSNQVPDSPESAPVIPQITEKQAKRLNTPLRAMVITMIALIGITLPFVWLQPHPDHQSYRPQVDVGQTSQEAREGAGFAVAAPDLDASWHANFARWNTGAADGVAFWEVGYVTPSNGYIAVTQTKQSNPTWLSQRVENAKPTGSVEAAGHAWETRVNRDAKSHETKSAYIGELSGTTVILYGTASDADFETLAQKVAASVDHGHNATSTPSSTA